MFDDNENNGYSFPPRLLTWEEAAYYARTCVTHIRQLAREGKIDVSIRKAGAHPRIFRESLDRWIDSTKVNYREVVENAVRPKNFEKK